MPKHMIRCSAKCPYYCCEDRHEIFCKGLSDGMRIHVAFASPAERKNWLAGKRHCNNLRLLQIYLYGDPYEKARETEKNIAGSRK